MIPQTAGILVLLLVTVFCQNSHAQDAVRQPVRCEILPLPEHKVSLQIDGVERCQWHFGKQYPRPFFYPLNGPSGVSLTRMGHPGASNHDHHRSVWFAHHKVNGLSFWADGQGTSIRQKTWLRYREGNGEAIMAVRLGWYDQKNHELMEQDVVAALIPLPQNEYLLELQSTARPGPEESRVTLNQTNFGLLAVRVARSISAHFGGGQLTNSKGAVGEPAIFGKPARWVDYSGPVTAGTGPGRRTVTEGITYFDHPSNPGHPVSWHVRADGWMGASVCMHRDITITAEQELELRYMLHIHSGDYDEKRAAQVFNQFSSRPGFVIRKPRPDERHLQFQAERRSE